MKVEERLLLDLVADDAGRPAVGEADQAAVPHPPGPAEALRVLPDDAEMGTDGAADAARRRLLEEGGAGRRLSGSVSLSGLIAREVYLGTPGGDGSIVNRCTIAGRVRHEGRGMV